MKFKVILKQDLEDGGYNVSCPALPGCHSQGDTVEEAISNIQDPRLFKPFKIPDGPYKDFITYLK